MSIFLTNLCYNLKLQASGVHGKLHGKLYSLSIIGSEPQTCKKIKFLIQRSSRPSNLPELCAQDNRGRLENHVQCERAKLELATWPSPFNSINNIPNWETFHMLLKEVYQQHDTFFTNIMKDLVKPMKKPIDEFLRSHASSFIAPTSKLDSLYESCAVVGNSATLLNRSYGAFIDTHEMVIRIDFADTHRFETFVGQKTTLAFIGEDVLHECAERSQTCGCQPYQWSVPTVTSVLVPEHYMDVAVCKYSHVFPLFATHVQFNRLCKRIAKWYIAKKSITSKGAKGNHKKPVKSSTGLQALVLALGMCKRVDVFGFADLSLAPDLENYVATNNYFSSTKEKMSSPKLIYSQKGAWPMVAPKVDLSAEFMFYKELSRNSKSSIPRFLSHAGITLPSVHVYT